jgi:protein-disulfide isomerase/uncharacterized membrane protein
MNPLWVIRLLLLAAIGVDFFLVSHTLTGKVLSGCGAEENCAQILSTRWAYWLVVPVSFLGLVTHAGLFLLSFRSEQLERESLDRFLLVALSYLTLFAAAWFVYLQSWVLGSFCRYCLTAHVLGCISSIGLLLLLPKLNRTRSDWSARLTAALLLIVLIGGQIFFPVQTVAIAVGTQPPATLTGSSQEPRLIKLAPNLDPVPLANFPVIGNPNGSLILVFFDFTCPNCRRAHPLLEQAATESNGKLCFVLIPVPINPKCNHYIANLIDEHRDACDYARMALALWHHHPDDFAEFSQQALRTGATPGATADITVWLESKEGSDAWKSNLSDTWVDTQLNWDVEGFAEAVKRSGHVEMPKFVIGGTIISGAPADLDELQKWISQYQAH